MKVLGIYQKLKSEGFVIDSPWESGRGNNLCSLGPWDAERKRYVVQLVSEAFLTKPAAEWETLIANAGVTASVIRTRDEWLALQPMLESGVLTKMNNGCSELTVPGRMVDVTGPGEALMKTEQQEAEKIDAAQADALLKPGVVEVEPQNGPAPLKKGDLLKGVKVLDLANIVAGPTASYTLAQYGAEVIRSETAEEEYQLPGLITMLLEINQGKRSILTDVKTAPGREVLRRLVSWADVVMHNIVDDTAKRMGVTHADLQAINPDVVDCQLTCWGGTYPNGWERRPGFDVSATASSGIMVQYGSIRWPQYHTSTSLGDTTGGLGLAFSALLGLYQKRKTGYTGRAQTSLVRMANAYQLPFMISENGHSNWGEAKGHFSVGERWWYRMYACRDDKWIFVGARDDQASALVDIVVNLPNADESMLKASFAERDSMYWLDTLIAAGIACHPVLSGADIAATMARSVSNNEANEVAEGSREVVRWDAHPSGVPIRFLVPNWVRIGEGQSYKRLSTAPRLGEHTRVILQELGYSGEEIEELIRLKICHEYLPAMGSKDAYFFRAENQ